MKRLTRILSVAACTLTVGAALALAGGANVKGRQIHQQRRIAQGARSGELTRAEARRLEKNAALIHRSVVRDRVDGGVFTPRERVKAQHRLNHQSRAIYRQKHDGQARH
jgi:protein involved in polysaccharide export with SLBB domain